MENTDMKFRDELREAFTPVPEVFTRAMEATLAEIVAQEAGERKGIPLSPESARTANADDAPLAPAASRAEKRRTHSKTRTGLVILIAALLLGTVAFAVASRLNALEVWRIDIPKEKEEAFLQKDLASYREGDIEVRMEEATYDGMTLYLVYSMRDYANPNLLGEDVVGDGQRYIFDGPTQAMRDAGFGWWTDNVYINGKDVNPIHGEQVFGGPNPGETLHYWQADYYLLDVYFTGDEVEIGIPILPHTEADMPKLQPDGTLSTPEHGLLTFKLDLDMAKQKREERPDFGPVQLGRSTISLNRVIYTPLSLYISVHFEAEQEAIDEVTARYNEWAGEDFIWPNAAFDVAGESGWRDLCLADAQGNYLGDVSMAAGADDAWYKVPALETWPEELYIAYTVRGKGSRVTDVNMENALRIR